jgi:hypothetical protein
MNVDLKDFFPSIHFGRIRGMLMAPPYHVPGTVATVIAQLCCNSEGTLPQGAPTSPILSNMVCAKLDGELFRLSRRFRSTYTRFVDDITFSCDYAEFPAALAGRTPNVAPFLTGVGETLEAIIVNNGFEVNHDKVRLQEHSERQEVTGLTVNQFPNVRRSLLRRIRAMLHAWKVYEHDRAEREFVIRYDNKHRGPYGRMTFRAVVKGYIDFVGMVRGVDDPKYRKFLEEFAILDRSRPKPLKWASANHITTYRDGIWVIEAGGQRYQGTAFEIGSLYALTCAHAVLDDRGRPLKPIIAYRPKRRAQEVPVEVIKADRDRDIAVLKLASSSGYAFDLLPADITDLRHGSPVLVAGFPQHREHASWWESPGQVTGHSHHIRSPRLLVSQRIVKGASGSPVMNPRHRVVGMASMGAESHEDGDDDGTVLYGVIPGRLLVEMRSAAIQDA